jgi:signal transduction histidine kinase
MNKNKLYWSFQIIGWSFYVLINSVVANLAVSSSFGFRQFIPLLAEAGFFFVMTHFYRYVIKRWDWIALPMMWLTPRVFISAVIIAFPIYFIRIGISYFLDMYDPELLGIIPVLGNAIPNALIIFIWSLFYFIYQYFEKYNLSLKHEAAFRQMELENLKSQLNPHFIFNSLNSIRALVDENPGKSKLSITQLSNIMRKSLVTDQSRLISFKQELETVKDYLSLEDVRYEERLRTSLDIDQLSYRFNVPPMMIQTLVENGIKHGVSKLKEGGELQLKTQVIGEGLNIEIRNSGQYSPEDVKNEEGGLGIKNTLQRLKLIYGKSATFMITNESTKNVLTKITIPQIQQI